MTATLFGILLLSLLLLSLLSLSLSAFELISSLIQCINSVNIFTFQNLLSNKYFWARQTYWLFSLRK